MSESNSKLNPSHSESSSCGGGVSEGKKFSYGFASNRGKRASMEDRHKIKIEKSGDKLVGLFGVFDGHGGSRAAQYVVDHLFENLLKHPDFISNPINAISETYKKTDQDYLDGETHTNHRDAGSTASTAVLVEKCLYVANVGDSRAVICNAGRATPLSMDHKPNDKHERQRIEKAGGVVMWSGTWRVGGVLAVSRAFGDKLLKKYVVAEPYVRKWDITDEDEFLVLASDGLWDVVSNEEAVKLVQENDDPEVAAKRLTDEAFSKGSADNITCVVIQFRPKD